MRGYLIDTNVVSEYNRVQLQGILRKEDGKRRRDLQRWFDVNLPARFAGSILVRPQKRGHNNIAGFQLSCCSSKCLIDGAVASARSSSLQESLRYYSREAV